MSIQNEPSNEKEATHLMLMRLLTIAEFLVAPPEADLTMDDAAQITIKKHSSAEPLYSVSIIPVHPIESPCEN